MGEPVALASMQLVKLFESRGMKVKEADVDKLQHINYYKLKEFAYPLANTTIVNGKNQINYNGVSFEDVLCRYYQDKNLRLCILHAIEKIEISVKTVLARELGSRYGAFGYLNFWLWANRNKNTRFKIEEQQYRIKKSIQKSLSKGTSVDYLNTDNLDNDKFPTVWLAIDLLTFGELVTMIEMLNSTVLRKIAAEYRSESQEFLSWIRCLHFIRNVCAHNSNLIDIKLKTKPKCRSEWRSSLYSMHNEQQTPTNRLAIVICIVLYLARTINPKYKIGLIQRSITSLCHGSETNAHLLGFKSLQSAQNIARCINNLLTQ